MGLTVGDDFLGYFIGTVSINKSLFWMVAVLWSFLSLVNAHCEPRALQVTNATLNQLAGGLIKLEAYRLNCKGFLPPASPS
jgi:hypothetical protein